MNDPAPSDKWLEEVTTSSVRLEGEAEERYVDRLLRVLRRARLNHHYPDPKRLRSHLGVLDPEVHQGLYSGLEINPDSGLPTYQEWTRAQTDVSIASEQLQDLGPRDELAERADQSDREIFDKQLAKFDYYSAIESTELAPLGDMEVSLRRVEPETETAYFHVVLDKLDASGLFVRFSIDLAQESSAWNEPVVELDDETAEHTEAFQSLIYKFTSLDSEFTFAKLAGLGGLSVERVAKGTVGPIWVTPEQAPDAVAPLFEQAGIDSPFLANFSLDRAARDIEESRDNDPLESMATQRRSDEAAAVYREARESLDYRVFKDRKFVAPREMVSDVQTFCSDRGTKNIVYGLR